MKKSVLPAVSLTLFLLLSGVDASCPARAQQAPATSDGGVTLQLPTDNGYSDLLDAIDIVRGKPPINPDLDVAPPPPSVFDKAQQTGATLADKRAAVHDPRFRQAIASLHAALSKPTLAPPVRAYSESIPDMAGLRNLSRLLLIREYVLFADGSTDAALDTLQDQLALGNAMQHWGLIHTLTGQAIIAIGVSPIATHLDRLSAGDCARLFDLLRAELNVPNPAIEGFHAESARAVADLRDALTTLGEGAERTSLASGTDEGGTEIVACGLNAAEVKEVVRLRTQKGAALDAFTENVTQRIASLNEAAIAANLEPSTSAPVRASARNETDSIAEKLARFFSPKAGNVGHVLDGAAVSRAGLQLLAVGAAVTRYRWEHNALPDSLDALKLGALATDPFTQSAIVYERSPDGRHFTLSCAGPLHHYIDNHSLDNHEDKTVSTGKRMRITLP